MLRISRAGQYSTVQYLVESGGNISVTAYDFISAAQAEVAQVCIQFRPAVDKESMYLPC